MRQVWSLLIPKNRWLLYYSSHFLIYRTGITIIHNRYRFLLHAPKSYSTSFAQMLIRIVLYHMPVWIGRVNSPIDASYWRACRSECLSIQKNCGPIPNLNCDDYEENDFFCYRIVGSVFIIFLMLHSPNSSFHSRRVTDSSSLYIGSRLESIFCYYAVSVIFYTMEAVCRLFTSSLQVYCF